MSKPAGEGWAVSAGVAALTLYYSLSSGGYDVVTRGELALLLWIALGLGWATGVLPRHRPARVLWPALAGFALLALWTLVCLRWTESDERTVVELGRVAHHGGVLLLAASVLTPRTWRAALAGLTAGLVAVAWLGLANWLWPQSLGTDNIRAVFVFVKRLNWPLDYFNGMGTLGVMAIVASMGFATHARHRAARAAAAAPVPGVVLATYLTYSRGAALELVVGLVVLLLAARHRIPALLLVLVTAAASALPVLVLRGHQPLVQGTGSAGAAGVLVLVVAAGLVAAAVAAGLATVRADERLRLPRRVGVPAMAGLALVAVVALAVVTPSVVRRAGDSLDSQGVNSETNPTKRFTSLGGGRLNTFKGALDGFRAEPVHGSGPGTFEFTWNRDPRYDSLLRDVHDLYLEALTESGVPGFLALAVALLGLVAVAVLAVLRAGADGPDRGAAAAVLAVLAVFLASAAVDWTWEMTVLPFAALVSVGAAGGFLSTGRFRRRLRPGRVVVPVVAVLAVVAVLPPVVSTSEVRASQASARAGRPAEALRQADDAIGAAPWSASAVAQKALLLEAAGRLRAAEGYAVLAERREPTNWRYALLRSRLLAGQGRTRAAIRAFARARRLAPRKAALQ